MKKKIDKALETVLVCILSILVVDVLWQVVSRYVLSSPSSFTDELAGFLLIWVGVLGAAYVAGKKEHLAIDLLVQKSTPATQQKLMFVIHALVAVFALLVLVVGGSWLVVTRFQLHVTSAALHLPLGYVYSVLPISGALMVYYSVLFMFFEQKDA